MKAAVYYENGGPEVLRYEEVPDPVCPPDGVIVDVEVVSLEGGDTLHRARTPFTDRPHVVGYQCAGVVREVGPDARPRRSVGDRVVVVVPRGSHAERVAVRAVATWAVPDGLDIVEAACVPVAFGTAHEALFALGKLAARQRVLIHAGAGGVGLAAIQLAKAAGAEVLTTASSDEKLERLRALGAKHVINYAKVPFAEAVTAALGPDALDLVIDPVGGKTLLESIACLKYRGAIVNLGVAGRDPTPFNPMALWAKNAALHGFQLTTALVRDYGRVHAVIGDCLARVARGELRVVLDRRFTLAEAAKAHAYVESRAAFGRVVMMTCG